MAKKEKCVHQVSFKCTDSEYIALCKLAQLRDRAVGDLAHRIIADQLFGLARIFEDCDDESNDNKVI